MPSTGLRVPLTWVWRLSPWNLSLIHISTAAMGLALRAAGAGKRVLVLQFFKDGSSSEVQALDRFDNVEVVAHRKQFGFFWTLSDAEKEEARVYYTALLEEVMAKSGAYGLLVLDEAMSRCV